VELQDTGIAGCFLMKPRVMGDARGWFAKTLHNELFEQLGLRTDWREEYFSTSARGVLRGMHFQLPPAEHAKMVFCVAGEVLDVIVDLRRGSPTEGQARSFTLAGPETGLYIPAGCAHGFLSKSENSIMFYKVTSVYAPQADAGIAWDSFGFDWGMADPILSDRDKQHPPLAQFDSPFRYEPEMGA
jgi:dTDP-4-dehydrorhamnose 3,5-epimerase